MKTENLSRAKNIVLFTFLVFSAQELLAQEATRPDFQEVMKSLKTHGGPTRFLEPFMKIYALDHPGFGAYTVPLKDVNRDGYNDFAVSTSLDTTFIFFGGPNLDDKPDGFVLGGEIGLVAIDFNNDGYTDIITSQIRNDPEGRGTVNIYLHNKTASMYDSLPSLKIVGRNRISGVGRMKGGDFNGDSISDLLIWSQDLNGSGTNASRGVLWLYLGKAIPDTIPDAQILDPHRGEVREYYGQRVYIADLNNDRFDDIIVHARGRRTINDTAILSHDVYLGNKNVLFGQPDKIISYYQDEGGSLDFVEFDGDGCKETHYFTKNPWPYFAWGHCEDFKRSQDFIPDTTFPNEEPNILAFANIMHQLGDIDASGFNEYVVAWAVSWQQNIIGLAFDIYRGGPGWQPKAFAYFGYDPFETHLYGYPQNLLDITGDGIDDFAATSGWYQQTGKRFWAPIWLYKGDRSLATEIEMEPDTKSDNFDFEIYPNPVTSAHSKNVFIRYDGKKWSDISLMVTDIFGRTIVNQRLNDPSTNQQTSTLELASMKSGVYFITCRTEKFSVTKRLILLDAQ